MNEVLGRIVEIALPVLVIVCIGYAYGRRHAPDMTVLNRIALDVLTPLLVFSALASRDFELGAHLRLLGAAALLILLTGALAWALAKAVGVGPRTLVPVVMFTNCGNMGLPLALLAFGPSGLSAAVALFAISNLIHFSLGARITSASARTRELLLTPLMLATLLGFLVAWMGWRLPEVPMRGVQLLGEASIPLLLFSLGARLTAITAAGLREGLLGALARPLIGLAVALPLVAWLGLEGEARALLLLFSALPPAVIQFILADRYGREPEKVAAMVLVGNALAIVFVPLALWLGL